MKLNECYYIEDLNECFDSEMYYYVEQGEIKLLERDEVLFVVNEKMSGYNWCILEYDTLKGKFVPGDIRTDDLANSEDDFLDVKKAKLQKILNRMESDKKELQEKINKMNGEIEKIEMKEKSKKETNKNSRADS